MNTRGAAAGSALAIGVFLVQLAVAQGVAASGAGGAARLHSTEAAGVHTLALDGTVVIRTTDAAIESPRLVKVPDSPALLATWTEQSPAGAQAYYAVSLDGQDFVAVRPTTYELTLRHGEFDPAVQANVVAPSLQATAENELYIVQFVTQPLEVFVTQLQALGGTVRSYLAQHAYIVQMTPEVKAEVEALPYVRWVGPFEPAYRLEEPILLSLAGPGAPLGTQRYRIEVFDADGPQKAALIEAVDAMGGVLHDRTPGGVIVDATLTPEQLVQVAGRNEVAFIDRWGPPVTAMNNVRIVGGANTLESVAGYTGTGVRGEIMDAGCQTSHPAFASRLTVRLPGPEDSHGTATFGIVFGDGTGNANGRGMLPTGNGIFSFWAPPNRYTDAAALVSSPYFCVFQSNSWGTGPFTRDYNTASSELDRIVFDYDIVILQAQGNYDNQDSLREAWGKNIVSVGGVFHFNDSSLANDVWNGSGSNASIGPAADGRVKPDLAYYYDSILTTTSGSAYTSGFGGTSAATPETAGHFGLFFQMWADGLFGNAVSGGTVFQERAHASTAKAAMINTAKSYSFSGTTADLTRVHQGWGLANVQNLYDWRNNILIVDETDVLQEFQTKTYSVQVIPGQSFHDQLRATLVYTDRQGTTSSSLHRINDLDLKVTSPSATVYYGNNGLLAGNWSTPGGSPNSIDTVENVFIQNPEAGLWTVEVRAADVNQDGHVETPQMDVDYGLVISGGNPFRDCNQNDVDDRCDVDCGFPGCSPPNCGTSPDCNANGIPDECDTPDCDGNGVPDACELSGNDCNADLVPDNCQLAGNDCDLNLVPDDCDVDALEAALSGPSSLNGCPLGTAIFSVSGAPVGSGYQWYKGATPLADGGDISGALSDTLEIANLDASDVGSYRCEVADGCIVGSSASASLALMPTTLTVTQQPVATVTICTSSGQGAIFQMTVDNTLGVSYQWYHDGEPVVNNGRITGATTNRLEIATVQTSDLGYYACHAENPCGATADTDPSRGHLVVADAVYSAHPQDACAEVGGAATFSVAVESPPGVLLFWFRDDAQLSNGADANGMVIAGATTDTLQLSNIPAVYDQSQFYVVGYYPSPACFSNSDSATLTVGGCPACVVAGDLDGDGDVDLADMNAFVVCFGAAATPGGPCECADLAGPDGLVNLDDWAALAPLAGGPQ